MHPNLFLYIYICSPIYKAILYQDWFQQEVDNSSRPVIREIETNNKNDVFYLLQENELRIYPLVGYTLLQPSQIQPIH